MKKNAPPPPDILRKSGPHKDKKKYDRKRIKQEEQKESGSDSDTGRRPST
jgi:hypothetical protein